MLIFEGQILNALKCAHGKKKDAAKILGISARTLTRKMQKPEFLEAQQEAKKFVFSEYLAELASRREG